MPDVQYVDLALICMANTSLFIEYYSRWENTHIHDRSRIYGGYVLPCELRVCLFNFHLRSSIFLSEHYPLTHVWIMNMGSFLTTIKILFTAEAWVCLAVPDMFSWVDVWVYCISESVVFYDNVDEQFLRFEYFLIQADGEWRCMWFIYNSNEPLINHREPSVNESRIIERNHVVLFMYSKYLFMFGICIYVNIVRFHFSNVMSFCHLYYYVVFIIVMFLFSFSLYHLLFYCII